MALAKRRMPGNVENLLSLEPNKDMTAFSFRQTLVSDMLIWGNGYAELEKDLSGRTIGLHHIEAERVRPMRDENSLQLFYRVSNRQFGDVDLAPSQVFHVPGFCRVAGFGMPAIAYMAETVGEGIAMREYSASFYANNATPSGILSTDQILKQETAEKLKHQFEAHHKGAAKSHKFAVLEAGLKWQSITGNNDTAQFVESRSFNVADILRFFRVSPHKVQHLVDASYNNVEQLERSHAQDSIAPIVTKLEQEADRKLFGLNRNRFFTRINMDELTRGDPKTRWESYEVGRRIGALNVDEIRAKEDMNPIGGVEGTARWWPSNTVPADKAYDQAQIQIEQAAPDSGSNTISETTNDDESEQPILNITRVHNAFRHILIGASRRCYRREANWAQRRVKKARTIENKGGSVTADIKEYLWGEGNASACRAEFEPVVTGIAEVSEMTPAQTAQKLDAIVEAHLAASYRMLTTGSPDPDNFDEAQAEAAVTRFFSLPERLAA